MSEYINYLQNSLSVKPKSKIIEEAILLESVETLDPYSLFENYIECELQDLYATYDSTKFNSYIKEMDDIIYNDTSFIKLLEGIIIGEIGLAIPAGGATEKKKLNIEKLKSKLDKQRSKIAIRSNERIEKARDRYESTKDRLQMQAAKNVENFDRYKQSAIAQAKG